MQDDPSLASGLTLKKHYLGGGAYADVWDATDRFDRPRAVKVIRKGKGDFEFIERQAKALARISHKNVVRVHDLAEVIVPDTGEKAIGIVMDKVEGPKLSVAIANGISQQDAKRIGLGILDGVEAIHNEKMFHNDLHDDNIIVGDPDIVIIDLLRTKSGSALSTAPREAKMKQDVYDVWLLLRAILISAQTAAIRLASFDRTLGDGTLSKLKQEFLNVIERSSSDDRSKMIANATAQFTDSAFVSGPEYADAIATSIPSEVAAEVIINLLNDDALRQIHHSTLSLVFSRLSAPERKQIASRLSERLNIELPAGKWFAPIVLLSSDPAEIWPLLAPATAIRVESVLLADLRTGHLDIHNALSQRRGALGTWWGLVWEQFKKPELLLEQLCSLLRQGWFTANYVGEHFLHVLPALARRVNQEAECIDAIKSAVANDARRVKSNLTNLPTEWQQKISAK